MNRFCSAAALALTLTAAAPLSAALASADGNRPDRRAVESVSVVKSFETTLRAG